ncbi:calcium/proton exchanger [Tanacetum coccineum]
MYIRFKGVASGWKAGCRRVIGLDGCFLKHTCKRELLTAIGRDVINQMYPIAWVVVRVKNTLSWSWFLSLLQEDLELGHGARLIIISDSHKGLLDVVSDWLPNAEHRKCTRHVFANFKNNFSVIPNGFQELEVRRGDESYGVNIHLKKCMCRLWELSGHNKRARDTEPVPKPPKVYKQPGRRREPDFSHYASNKGGGRGSRGVTLGGRGETSGVKGETSQTTKGIHGTNKGDQTEGTLSGASRGETD